MKCYTHAGKFHADEVFAFAILKAAGVCNAVERLTKINDTNDIPEDGIVVDIGGFYDTEKNKFDHHQGLILRPDGSCYASAGLVWKAYGKQMITKNMVFSCKEIVDFVWNQVDEKLIKGIDSDDADSEYSATAKNRVGEVPVMTISNVIANYNSNDIKNDVLQGICFGKAVEFSIGMLLAEIQKAYFLDQAITEFENIATFERDGKVVVLEKFVTWREIICEKYPDALFVILPSGHPGSPFSMIAVPVNPTSRKLKKEINRSDWFEGFIHQGKWIAGGESVIELVNLADYNLNL